MAAKRIAVVTGGNKGIGLEIGRQLASSGNNLLVILTARDEKRGMEAVDKLKASGLLDLVFHQLDVTDQSSIASLADFIKSQFGKLDILVNNAGISGTIADPESFWSLNLPSEIMNKKADKPKKVARQTYESAEKCLKTNYYGAKNVTQALLPLLLQSSSAKIVNISSKLGQLYNIEDKSIKKILSDSDGLTEGIVDEIVDGYLQDAKDDDLLQKKGWSSNVSAYIISKAALNAYSRVLAVKHPSVCVNAVSPGFVATDMTFYKGTYTVEQGARGPVQLALMPDGGPSGRYFWQMEESSF